MSSLRSLISLCACQILVFGTSCSISTDSSTPTTPDTSQTSGEPHSPGPDADPSVASTTQQSSETTLPVTDGDPAVDTPGDPSLEPADPTTTTPDDTPATDSADLENLSRQDLIKAVSNGVVLVSVFDARGEKLGFGSGSVVGDGQILTNFHVIDSAVSATVQLRSEEETAPEFPVTGFLQVDEANDLALLHVEGLPDDLYQFKIAGPGSVEQFEEVFAIGHPDGLKFSVTRGFVNASMPVSELPEVFQYSMSSNETRLIQTDAVIAGGSSGGPLLNLRGELIGINTLHVPETQFAFSVEAGHVRDLMETAASAEVSSLPVPGADVLVTALAASLQFDFHREWMQLTQDMRAATSREEMEDIARRNNPAPECVQQCLDLVRGQTSRTQAFDALKLGADVVRSTGEQMGDASRYYLDQAFDLAASNPELTQAERRVVDSLIGLRYSEALEEYLRAVVRDNDDEQVQAAAILALAFAISAETGSEFGADRDELVATLVNDYGPVLVRGSRIEEYVEAYLSQGGAIGSIAREIVGEDHEGVEFRLSDYQGKVVVLDFWADWCPHCRVMYEHEREMVERLKDEEFALLGVNCDEPARAQRVISSGQITWRSWMDGQGGPITREWNIQAYPTVYVLDKEGRIRFEGIRGADLEAAVEELLYETELRFADDMIAGDAAWKFTTVSAVDEHADWRTAGFDDGAWSNGSGLIGYGRSDLDTAVESGAPGERPMTLLFRHQFELPHGDIPERPYLKLRYNDGVAVFLNGTEVYRNNLTSDAGLHAAAPRRASGRESDIATCVPVEAGLLAPGGNIIAVEVHQVSAYSADALFALTLGANLPELSPDEDGNSSNRLEVCRLIGQVADGSSRFVDALRAYAEDEDPKVRTAAVTAAALIGEQVEFVGFDDEEAQTHLYEAAYYLNEDAWRVAMTPGLSGPQYQFAVRMAEAGLALKSELPEEYQEILKGLVNTLGVALYRAGDLETAIARLEESRTALGDNPVDLAFLSLAHRGLGATDEADQHRQAFVEMMSSPDWEHDRAGLEASGEVEQAFGPEE